MGEKETVYSSSIKYKGLFNFSDLYQFMYDWMAEEMDLDVEEGKYVEKLKTNEKDIDIEWKGTKKVTDYFKFEVSVDWEIRGLSEVEIKQENAKIKTNKGPVKIKVKGKLIRDYEGKFETSAFSKFWRGIYDKWVIQSRIEEMEENLANSCDTLLNQAKAWLDLEGKKGGAKININKE